MKESNSYFLCPTNTAMTGRYHKDDENGKTQYEYATLKAVDENGKSVSGTITVEDVNWSTAIKESSSNFTAPSNRVIVGRQHNGDENEDTKYATAVVKYNGQVTFVEDNVLSGSIKESSGIWFKTDSNRVMTGRHHNGDENDNTTYYSGIITTNLDPEQEIKIIVALHPDEKFFPMNPLDFIKQSRFRRHNSGKKDDGYNKVLDRFVDGNNDSGIEDHPEYYGIPVATIDQYHTADFEKNVRPRDENNDSDYDLVFLQPDDHSPGNKNPTGNVPVFVYSSYHVVNGQNRERKEYWMFYGYNDVENGVFQASHQGDWERVTIDIYNNEIVAVYLDQHGKSNEYELNKVELTKSNGVQILKVYSAKGTHGTFEKVGEFSRPGILLAKDKTADGGVQWEITKKVLKLTDQGWIHYGGAWGEVGKTTHGTGPLGPWYKRMDR